MTTEYEAVYRPSEYVAKFTDGTKRTFLGLTKEQAREAARSWMWAYKPWNVYLQTLERVK